MLILALHNNFFVIDYVEYYNNWLIYWIVYHIVYDPLLISQTPKSFEHWPLLTASGQFTNGLSPLEAVLHITLMKKQSIRMRSK